MEAGRELDTLIAEKIMGLETGSIGIRKIVMERGYGCGTYECQKFHPRTMPEYSTDIAAAWEVVEKLRSVGYSVDISAYPDNRKWLKPQDEKHPRDWKLTITPEKYQCSTFKYMDEFETWVVWSDPVALTAPHAVCLAALKSLEPR